MICRYYFCFCTFDYFLSLASRPEARVALELNTAPLSARFNRSVGASATAITHGENKMCWGRDANASRQRLSAAEQTSRRRPNTEVNQFCVKSISHVQQLHPERRAKLQLCLELTNTFSFPFHFKPSEAQSGDTAVWGVVNHLTNLRRWAVEGWRKKKGKKRGTKMPTSLYSGCSLLSEIICWLRVIQQPDDKANYNCHLPSARAFVYVWTCV